MKMAMYSTFMDNLPSYGREPSSEEPSRGAMASKSTSAPPSIDALTMAFVGGYLPSTFFGWQQQAPTQTNKNKEDAKSAATTHAVSKNGASDISVISEITEQRCNKTTSRATRLSVVKVQDAIPESASEEEIDVDAIPERSAMKDKQVDDQAKDHNEMHDLVNLAKKKKQKKKSRRSSSRKQKRDELKKYLKKSLKTYLRDAGPEAIPQNSEQQKRLAHKKEDSNNENSKKKDCKASRKTDNATTKEQVVSTTLTPVLLDQRQEETPDGRRRQGVAPLIAIQPSADFSTMSGLGRQIQSEFNRLGALTEKIDNLHEMSQQQEPLDRNQVEDIISQMSQELDAFEGIMPSTTMNNTPVAAPPSTIATLTTPPMVESKRELSPPSHQQQPGNNVYDETILCQSASKEAASRWKTYMTSLRATRVGNDKSSTGAAAVKETTKERAAESTTPAVMETTNEPAKSTSSDSMKQSEQEKHMQMMEKKIAVESFRVSLEMAKSREHYMSSLKETTTEEKRDAPASIMEETRGGTIKNDIQFQNPPSVCASSGSVNSEKKRKIEAEITEELAKLQTLQSDFIYKVTMAAYDRSRPNTILKSDIFSKNVFKGGPLKSKEAKKEDSAIQRELELLRAAQADLFAKGTNLLRSESTRA